MARDFKKEYKDDQKKRKKYRAGLRKTRVEAGLTNTDGTANGNGETHVAHKKYAKGKAGGATTLRSAKANLKDQPKRKKKKKA